MNTSRRDSDWLCRNRGECEVPAPHVIVRNPAHYTEGRQIEPIDVIEDWQLPFHLGNALKYIASAGRKGDSPELIRQDISKAIWYLERFSDQFIEAEAQANDADWILEAKEKKDYEGPLYARHPDLGTDKFVPVVLGQEHVESEAMVEKTRINDIPSSILFGADDPVYENYPKDLNQFGDDVIFSTYEKDGQNIGISKNGKKHVLNDGIPGVQYEDVITFFEDDSPFKSWIN